MGAGGPYWEGGPILNCGRIWYAQGSSRGLSAVYDLGQEGAGGSSEADDYFGFSLAVGDFDADGFADLASANFTPNSVSVLLNTGPTPTVAPTSLTFAAQPPATLSSPQSVTATNSAEGYPLEVSRVSTTGTNSNDFIVTGDTCSGESVSPSGTCQVTIRFAPDAAGARNASLEVRYNGLSSPRTLSLIHISEPTRPY